MVHIASRDAADPAVQVDVLAFNKKTIHSSKKVFYPAGARKTQTVYLSRRAVTLTHSP